MYGSKKTQNKTHGVAPGETHGVAQSDAVGKWVEKPKNTSTHAIRRKFYLSHL